MSFAGRRPAHHATLRSPTLPFGRGFNLSPIPSNAKGAAHWATPFTFGGGGGSLSLRCRSTDLRFASATRALQAQVQLSRRTNKKTTRWVAFLFVGGGGGS